MNLKRRALSHLRKPFDDWRICPHGEADACAPRPGMFLDLAATHDVDFEVSLHVGDSQKDRDAARAVGLPFAWAHDFFSARSGR